VVDTFQVGGSLSISLFLGRSCGKSGSKCWIAQRARIHWLDARLSRAVRWVGVTIDDQSLELRRHSRSARCCTFQAARKQ
jgi:hypothetical protein